MFVVNSVVVQINGQDYRSINGRSITWSPGAVSVALSELSVLLACRDMS